MRGVVTALLLLAALGHGDIVFRDTEESSAPPVDLFSDAEIRCILHDKVLHSDGNCYKLMTSGPCGVGEWLVVDKNNTQNPRQLVCKERPCNKPLRVLWTKDGQCHKVSDKRTLCPHSHNTLKPDSYGEGQCVCDQQHVRLKSEILQVQDTPREWVGDCHPLFRRGPCPVGKVLLPVYMQGHGMVGRCRNDPCARENGRDPNGGFVKQTPDGPCYQLGTTGPCPKDQQLNVHSLTSTLQCYALVNAAISDQPLRCGGNVDLKTQECREEINVKMENNPFVTTVTRPRRTSGRR